MDEFTHDPALAAEETAGGSQVTKVFPVDLEKEMKKSFLEYSMSVIVSRAQRRPAGAAHGEI